VLLNINGFYDQLITFLDHCVAEGMLKPKNREVLLVANTVEEALIKVGIPGFSQSSPDRAIL
jgi:predicted Rossmann-fold nucleotide-binding protein